LIQAYIILPGYGSNGSSIEIVKFDFVVFVVFFRVCVFAVQLRPLLGKKMERTSLLFLLFKDKNVNLLL